MKSVYKNFATFGSGGNFKISNASFVNMEMVGIVHCVTVVINCLSIKLSNFPTLPIEAKFLYTDFMTDWHAAPVAALLFFVNKISSMPIEVTL